MHLMFLLGRRTGQVLEASIENGNPEDRHTVALHKPGEGETLRHMPREISNGVVSCSTMVCSNNGD